MELLQYDWQCFDTTEEELNPDPPANEKIRKGRENLYRSQLKAFVYHSPFADNFAEEAEKPGAKAPDPNARPPKDHLSTRA